MINYNNNNINNKLAKIFIFSFSFIFFSEASLKDYYRNIVSKGQDLFTRNKTECFNKAYDINKCPVNSINIKNINGNINIKVWDQNKIEVQAIKKAIPKYLDNTAIKTNIKNQKLYIETIAKSNASTVNFNLMLPKNINLNLAINQGNIKIKNITGSIQAQVLNSGNIDISKSCKTVIAKTQSGNIKLKTKQLKQPDTIFLNSFNGSIAIDLPKNCDIDLQLSTQNGLISSEQEIILNPKKVILNKKYWNQVKREVNGKIKKGGPVIIAEAKKGHIKLKEY